MMVQDQALPSANELTLKAKKKQAQESTTRSTKKRRTRSTPDSKCASAHQTQSSFAKAQISSEPRCTSLPPSFREISPRRLEWLFRLVMPGRQGTTLLFWRFFNYSVRSLLCVVYIGEGESAPVFVAEPFNQVAVEKSTITLECAANGNPKPAVYWLKDGTSIDLASLDSR